MDAQHFDRLTQQFGRMLSRRRVGAVLAALGLGAGLGAVPDAEAKKKKKKKPKKCKNGAVKCGKACINTKTNAAHCGGCGRRCDSGQSCVGGACQSEGCTGDRELCGTACVDPANDEQHCGGCNRACNGDLTCLNGDCGCAAGTRCGTACVDLDDDDEHCGECDNACNGDLTCLDGECGCAAGTRCGNQCVNTQTNPNHCGACDDACDPGQSCSGGECGEPPECVFDSDCRAVGIGPTCQNGRCACTKPGEGVCLLASGARACSVCCPGGSGACLGDFVCRHDSEFSWPTCFCPGDSEICTFGRCSRDFDTDERRCGLDCVDCTDDPGGACCWSRRCVRGCGIGELCSERFGPCGGGCEPCPEGQICCNEGPDTPTQCLPDLFGGFCYRPS